MVRRRRLKPRAAKRARLLRDPSTEQGTLGLLVCGDDGALTLHTIEPPWRDNRPNRSCIPVGAYEVVPHRSPRYGACYLVADVPGRSHILVHAGNVGGDRDLGFHTHTLGCLLPGLARGRLRVRGRTQIAALSSRPAVRQWMEWAAGDPVTLEISDA